jgi:hypothetical protein
MLHGHIPRAKRFLMPVDSAVLHGPRFAGFPHAWRGKLRVI